MSRAVIITNTSLEVNLLCLPLMIPLEYYIAEFTFWFHFLVGPIC